MIATALLLACAAATAGPPDGPEPRDAEALNLADLGPYRAALEGRPGGEAEPVGFRQLWDEPARYQGRRVRVEGRVLRRFRQGAFGTFPPLVEAWALSPAGDPFCLVFPDPNPGGAPRSARDDAAPGAAVRFEGVFLRQIRYQGGDAPRLAPLLVGDRPPLVVTPAPAPVRWGDPAAWGGLTRLQWSVAFLAAATAGLWLARRHLRSPSRRSARPRPELDPPPEFLEHGPDA